MITKKALQSCSTALLSLLVVAGCGEAADAPDQPSDAGGKADEADGDGAPVDAETAKAAIADLGFILNEVGVELGEQEAPIVGVLAYLPLGDIELDDDDDLAEFTRGLDHLVAGLTAGIDAGTAFDPDASSVTLDGASLCGGISLSDVARAQCIELTDAANLQVGIAKVGHGFQFSVRHPLDGGTPITFSAARRGDEIELDVKVAMPDIAPLLALIETVLEMRDGALRSQLEAAELPPELEGQELPSEIALAGSLQAKFRAGAGGALFEVGAPDGITFTVDDAAVELDPVSGEPLVRVTVDPVGDAQLDIAIGDVMIHGPSGRFTDDPQLGDEVDLAWGGMRFTASGTPDDIRFLAEPTAFKAEVLRGDRTQVVVAYSPATDAVSGSVDRDAVLDVPFLPDIKGTAIKYDDDYKRTKTYLDLVATHITPAGSKIIDVGGSLRATTQARAEIALETSDLSKIDFIKCALEGKYTVMLEDGTVLEARANDDDDCLVGYFTREEVPGETDENGDPLEEPRYNYITI